MDELKPCPFCGGEVTIESVYTHHGMDGSYKNWHIYCTRCGIGYEKAADPFYGRKYLNKEQVIEEWNWRADK